MELIEIEGDALFFLGRGPRPTLTALEQQSKHMYEKFHEHLLLYEKNRICPCGACKTAHNLQLKFVFHAADVSFISVGGKEKPHGPDVIKIHRLLKNDVPTPEYLLTTQSDVSSDYYNLTSSYDFGPIDYAYKDLSYLKEDLDIPTVRASSYLRDPDAKLQFTMQTDLQRLADYILDFSVRLEWNPSIDKFLFNKDHINQQGESHVCVIGNQNLDIQTVTKPGETDQVIYGERITNAPFAEELTTFFIITPIDEDTQRLEVEVFLEQKKWIHKLLKPVILSKFKKNISENIGNLQKLVESI